MVTNSTRMLRRVIGRRSYSLKFGDEALEFANRKALIKERPQEFYPLLDSLRTIPPVRVPEFLQKFKQYSWSESKRVDEVHTVEGRIQSIRRSGKGMVFMDLAQDLEKVQLVLMNKLLQCSAEELAQLVDQFKKGDHVVATGFPGVTNVGELSLKLNKQLKMAAPIMHPIPPKLTDSEKRHGNRVVDYLVNPRSRAIIVARAYTLKQVRLFFENRGFIEVETPMLSANSNGANAAPFVTTSKHIKLGDKPVELQLRVAPELWLKRLVVGGLDKVFEVSKVFRNEGIDGTHNPEFTTVEFYQTFTTLEELMSMTEQLLHDVCVVMKGHSVTSEKADQLLKHCNAGFKKLEFIPEVEKAAGLPFPEASVGGLTEYLNELKIPLPKIKSVPHLLDKLSSTYLEPQCDSPTFIYHQPALMSSLSKSTLVSYTRGKFEVSRRFELFIQGQEYINAYEEENSPIEQSAKFALQQSEKAEFHDDDTPLPDQKFVDAMEWGLPPTGGWGMGIDRLVMLLVGERIEEVLTFGTLPDVVRQ